MVYVFQNRQTLEKISVEADSCDGAENEMLFLISGSKLYSYSSMQLFSIHKVELKDFKHSDK